MLPNPSTNKNAKIIIRLLISCLYSRLLPAKKQLQHIQTHHDINHRLLLSIFVRKKDTWRVWRDVSQGQ